MIDYADRAHAWADAYLIATGRHPSPGKIRRHASAPVESLATYRVSVWDSIPDHARGLPEVPGGVIWEGERPDSATLAMLKRLEHSADGHGLRVLSRTCRLLTTLRVRPLAYPAWALVQPGTPRAPRPAVNAWNEPVDLAPGHGFIVWRDRHVHQVTRPGHRGAVGSAGEPGTRYRAPIGYISLGGTTYAVGNPRSGLRHTDSTRHGHLIGEPATLSCPGYQSARFHGATWCLGQAQPVLSAALYRRDWQACAESIWGVMAKHNPEISRWSFDQSERAETARRRTRRAVSAAIGAGPWA